MTNKQETHLRKSASLMRILGWLLVVGLIRNLMYSFEGRRGLWLNQR